MSFFKDRSVLVVGGAGFIGSYLVELLAGDGAIVTVLDNLSRGRKDNLENVADSVRFVLGDARDPDVARATCAGQAVVMNLAAPVSGVEYSRTHHAEMLTETLLLNSSVISAAAAAGAERYLYCSSSCVYPDDATVPTPESEGWRGAPERDNEGYGWGKRMGEVQARYFAQQTAMKVAIARPFNGYGPREHPEEITRAHVVPALISRILDGENPLSVWGSGQQTRSFVHARDFAMGLKLVVEHYPTADPVNVGHNTETSIRELVDILLNVTGRELTVWFDLTKPEGARRKSADTSKLRDVTGFVPETDLRSGLVEMVDYLVRLRSSALPTGAER
jgi:nucleoside-diphosphate-sugar epimerase